MAGVVSGFGRIVTYAMNGLDMSSAANDVIVVQHQDGTLHSSPFNVRFGKLKVLRPQDKVVSIEVNGEITKAVMKIGSDGEAFWLKPTTEAVDSRAESPVDPLTSPVLRQQAASPNATAVLPPISLSEGGMRSPASPTKHKDPVTPSLPRDDSTSREVNAVDLNALHIVDPAHGVVEEAVLSQPTLERASDQASLSALEAINSAGDSELESVLGKEVADTGEVSQQPAALHQDPAAYFAEEMSEEQRHKYDELLRSITTAAQQGRSEGLTLSKFASHDDIAAAVAGAIQTPHTVFDSTLVGIPAASMMSVGNAANSDGDRSLDEEEDLSAEEDYDEESESDGDIAGSSSPPVVYYQPTLTPISADLLKLRLKPGHNKVRYYTHSSLKGRVVVDSNIYLWPSDAKIVVSDIDGTITKSDVWGHILPMIGRDWTHAGICSLYSKVAKNGYEFVYLTARSMAQQEQTRNFLWSIEQDGTSLPRGPVMTAPDRFFTALTQEVSKKAHEFKITCLQGIDNAFPRNARPFYAGFGNRLGDVISYTARQIPKHKIFIIDTTSTLHVCRVKHTYKNLAHLVDVTFPPLKPSGIRFVNENGFVETPSQDPAAGSAANAPGTSTVMTSGNAPQAGRSSAGMAEGEVADPDFNSFNFWRVPPEELIQTQISSSVPQAKKEAKSTQGADHPSFVNTLPRGDVNNAPVSSASGASSEKTSKGWLRWFSGGSSVKDPANPTPTAPTSVQGSVPAQTPSSPR